MNNKKTAYQRSLIGRLFQRKENTYCPDTKTSINPARTPTSTGSTGTLWFGRARAAPPGTRRSGKRKQNRTAKTSWATLWKTRFKTCRRMPQIWPDKGRLITPMSWFIAYPRHYRNSVSIPITSASVFCSTNRWILSNMLSANCRLAATTATVITSV